MRALRASVHSLSALIAMLAGTAQAATADDFHALLDEHWATAGREQVFFRTDPDAFRMNGRLPSFSDEAHARREAYNGSVLERLAQLDPNRLSATDRISYRVFLYERLTERDSYRQLDRYFPINALFGYHTYFADAPANMAFLSAQDYDKYLVSLADFPRYNTEHIDTLRRAAQDGYTQFCDSMRGYDKTISKHVVATAEQSALYGPFERFPGVVGPEDRAAYTRQGAALIREAVLPEYRRLLAFYNDEYAPRCRKTAGISSVPGGKDYYGGYCVTSRRPT